MLNAMQVSSAVKLLEKPALVAALLFLAACIVLCRCWDAPFYRLDDRDQALPGAERSVADILKTPRPKCFPVTALSFKLDYILFGGGINPRKAFESVDSPESMHWAAGSRLLNGFYHFLAACVLWLFLRRLNCGPAIATFVALAWAVHPVACEAVCWVAERKNVLAALFGFAALAAWTVASLWRWPLIALLFGLAVYSKTSALGLLPVLLFMEIVFARRSWREPRYWLELAVHLALPIAVFYAGLRLTWHVYPYDLVEPPGGSMYTAVLTDVVIGARYLFNTFAPVNLSFYYAVDPVRSLADIRLWGCLLAIAVFFGVLLALALPASSPLKNVHSAKIPVETPGSKGVSTRSPKVFQRAGRRALAGFGIFWFIGAVAPKCNLVADAFPMQDRFIYLSIPGILLTAALAFEGAAARWKLPDRWRAAPGAACLLGLSVLTGIHSALYVNERVLAVDAAQRNPGSGYAQLNAGLAYKNLAIECMPGTPNPDLELMHRFAALADRHLEAASACHDIGFFSDKFEIRTIRSEMMVLFGDHARARELLNGWLPPSGMQMLPDDPVEAQRRAYKRDLYYAFYRRGTLSFAWAILGEASLEEARLPNLSRDEQASRCRQGLEEVGQALKIKADDIALMLKARLLLTLSANEAIGGTLDLARQHFDDAIEILKNIPATSRIFSTAKETLDNEASMAHRP